MGTTEKPTASWVRIFPNGMIELESTYAISNEKPTPFDLTVRTDALDDLITSMRVRGNVKLPVPLTFTANNAEKVKISIKPSDPLSSLLTDMTGAKITVTSNGPSTATGLCLGTESCDEFNNIGTLVKSKYICLIKDDGTYCRLPVSKVVDWKFDDEADRQLVAKAIESANSEIRPGTTKAKFSLQGEGEHGGSTPMSLRYVEPNAAPLMCYNLSIDKTGKFRISATGVIHNFTDQSWKNTTVELVSGFKPHTFRSDSSVATVPERNFIQLADATATGGRMVAAGMSRGQLESGRKFAAASASTRIELQSMAPQMAMSMADNGPGAGPSGPLNDPNFSESELIEGGGMQRLVCDDKIEELPPKQSVNLTMFRNRDLPSAATVLIYRKHNGVKPDRAFRIKNTTGISFLKGPILIDQEMVAGEKVQWVNMGKAILEATQPNEDRMVVYGTDANVTVRADQKPTTSRLLSISFKDGTGRRDSEERSSTEYRVINVGNEDCELYLDHQRTLRTDTVKATGCEAHDPEVLPDKFYRHKCKVKKTSDEKVVVQETFKNSTYYNLGDTSRNYATSFLAIIGEGGDELINDPAIQAVLQAAKALDAKDKEIADKLSESKRYKAQQDRVNATIANLTNANRDSSEKEIVDLHTKMKKIEDTEVPELQKTRDTLEQAYDKTLRALSKSWNAA